MTEREMTDDLALLQYPELERRRDALAAEIEGRTIAGGIFDPAIPDLVRRLDDVRDALRRKRETSAGKGTPRKKGQGEDDGPGDAGSDDPPG